MLDCGQVATSATSTVDWDVAAICRDDRCDIEHIHPIHDIQDTPRALAKRKRTLGWEVDPLEPDRAGRGRRKASDPALLESVLRAICWNVVKPFSRIKLDVMHDYGDIYDRKLNRYIRKLLMDGLIVQVRPSTSLPPGYVLAGSRLLKGDNTESILTQIEENMSGTNHHAF